MVLNLPESVVRVLQLHRIPLSLKLILHRESKDDFSHFPKLEDDPASFGINKHFNVFNIPIL